MSITDRRRASILSARQHAAHRQPTSSPMASVEATKMVGPTALPSVQPAGASTPRTAPR
jgi:hypothetical protein